MDINSQRPRSRRQSAPKGQEQGTLTPKVFNCIVDDIALIQGAKKSTRDGIPKWIAGGRIRLFVPLYALNQTSRLKDTKGKLSNDASEALQWLDDATSEFPDFVTLQGGYDQYERWDEVEKYALPKPLFSEEDATDREHGVDDVEYASEQLKLDQIDGEVGQSFSSNESFASASTVDSHRSHRSTSPLSPPISPPKVPAYLASSGSIDQQANSVSRGTFTNDDTPRSIRPLFNYIIWRVHQETDPTAALDSFIFVSDNAAMRKHAQRFGIRCKTLAEIRYVIARESQDARNRQAIQKKESFQVKPAGFMADAKRENVKPLDQATAKEAARSPVDHPLSDEDEILFRRAPKAPAALTKLSPRGRGRAIDPNQFQRSPRGAAATPVRGRGSMRGNPGRGRGVFTPRGRGNSPAQQQPDGPIDPNSFARPSPGRGRARGGRGLWMPT